ncbi:transposase [Muricauda ruestringensis]|uniref:Transposase n=1 Tax=Flagellimonas aurea TaxID=2915619 RepID=A0ABS3G1U8_9FLAO|nr:transposase [Allomuricauda aurea]
MNGESFIESFNGLFRDECLNANWFFSLEDAQEKFDICKEAHNNYILHSSLVGRHVFQ